MFPCASYDVKAAIRSFSARADPFHLEPLRLSITGASAGGNLTVLTAVTFGESIQVVAKQRKATEVQAAANHLDQSSDIQCGVSLDAAFLLMRR